MKKTLIVVFVLILALGTFSTAFAARDIGNYTYSTGIFSGERVTFPNLRQKFTAGINAVNNNDSCQDRESGSHNSFTSCVLTSSGVLATYRHPMNSGDRMHHTYTNGGPTGWYKLSMDIPAFSAAYGTWSPDIQ